MPYLPDILGIVLIPSKKHSLSIGGNIGPYRVWPPSYYQKCGDISADLIPNFQRGQNHFTKITLQNFVK
jgi:hypothetical protein